MILNIPEELHELMLDHITAIKCRDQAIKSLFKAKRAIYYGKEAEKAKREFWNKVYELYPELDDSEMVYKFNEMELHWKDKNEDPQ